MSSVKITGLSDLQNLFSTLAPKIETSILRSAMRQGANVFKSEAVAHCPTAAPNTENQRLYGAYLGALKSNIRVGTRTANGVVTGYCKVGGKFKGANVFYAHMIEFGTKAHRINPGKKTGKKALLINGSVRRSVWHFGAVAKPFMLPAFDAKVNQAVLAVAETIKEKLTLQGINTADVDVAEEAGEE